MRVSTSRKGGGARLVVPGAGPAPLVGSGSPAWRVQRRRGACPAAPRQGVRGAPQKRGSHPDRFCGTSPAVQIPLIYNKRAALSRVRYSAPDRKSQFVRYERAAPAPPRGAPGLVGARGRENNFGIELRACMAQEHSFGCIRDPLSCCTRLLSFA